MRILTLVATLTLAVQGSLHSQIPRAEYAARRDSLAAAVEDGAIVVFGAREPQKDYISFYQDPHFLYLTGVREPNAGLVIVKRGGRATGTIFVQPRDPAAEVWTAARMGTDTARARTGLAARTAEDFLPVVDSLAGVMRTLYVVGDFGGEDPLEPSEHGMSFEQEVMRAIASRHDSLALSNATPVVLRLRSRKSPAELELIRTAVNITVDAHRQAMLAIEPGMNEFEIQALIEYTFRRNGADRPSFSTIVGSGPNATTLHYNADDRFMRAGDVVVMDIGASYRGYAADVTRTVPVTGTFTAEQRAIYQIVRDAQAAAEKAATPGASFGSLSRVAQEAVESGLARVGLIEGVGAMVEGGEAICGQEGASCPQWVMYYMHGLGHGIGLDVHDPEQSQFQGGRINAGSAFTMEPGVYVRANLLSIIPDTPKNRAMIAKIRSAVERHANIGVRIEDDYIVTPQGVEWISKAPREIPEIEALMAQRWAGPPARNEGLVRQYEKTGS
ncbi:MAG: aminopeptidase P N-terminal domain-containing protein [Gemmatimonadaceae bacterium]